MLAQCYRYCFLPWKLVQRATLRHERYVGGQGTPIDDPQQEDATAATRWRQIRAPTGSG
jgi:hypothetical protein